MPISSPQFGRDTSADALYLNWLTLLYLGQQVPISEDGDVTSGIGDDVRRRTERSSETARYPSSLLVVAKFGM
jgi:hypothetical protein